LNDTVIKAENFLQELKEQIVNLTKQMKSRGLIEEILQDERNKQKTLEKS